jgi:hypothetical protein
MRSETKIDFECHYCPHTYDYRHTSAPPKQDLKMVVDEN